MSKKIILACMFIMALGSCKKDYQKLATEFERALPDTVQVATTWRRRRYLQYICWQGKYCISYIY